ncbi:P-loop containing nucleoside triphosphate hydrolase protein [Aspergillus pseudocaelatus]|uniref:P-loop containing nucleoside triphosphate hydrolase protein n=1 Tax=Aspergillus pseudocaelatus TaxID=1825620 RepID=A0ABQ6W3T7_9EURO|nr:P-loop containing nucleoside triphosphate hydrolase protein [Aspergillus pseudocaelatus]
MNKDVAEPVSESLPVYRPRGRGIGVAFHNVSVEVDSENQRTVLDLTRILSNIVCTPGRLLRKALGNKPPARRSIIRDVSGLVLPGETMLVLGRPGSGCTTLLKVLAGTSNSFEAVKGDLHYSGLQAHELAPEFKSEIIYCSEDDIHFPNLLVKDTLDFALKQRRPATLSLNGQLFSAEYTQRILASLGIAHTAKTIVGDSFIRGVSGGERRRVSLAEVLAANPAIACWDNPIRGLDSSSALSFLHLLKKMSMATGMTNMVTLYQASERMYQECFDRVVVMYDGYMVFSGQADVAKQYFENLGFYCPGRQTTPEFLTSVTSPAERQIRPDYHGPLYLDAVSLARAFQQSEHYQKLQVELQQYAARSQSHPEVVEQFREAAISIRSKMSRPHSIEPSSAWRQIITGAERYYRLFWSDRNTFYTVLTLCSINALIAGSGFYAAPKTMSGSFERSGAVFFAATYFCMTALTEVIKTVKSRAILVKQHSMGLISPAAYAIIQTTADIPSALIQSIMFSICYYFLIGLSLSASQFFIFVLLVFVHFSAISSMFRMLGAWAPGLGIARLLAGCAMPIACVYAGYAPPVPSMHRWGSWIRRITPTPYAVEAMIGNEFYNIVLHCTDSQLVPNGPGYNDIRHQACPMQGAQPGSALADGAVYAKEMYGFTRNHLWRNFGIMLVLWFLYTVLSAVGLTVMARDSSNGTGPVFKRGAAASSSERAGLVKTADIENQVVDAPLASQSRSAGAGNYSASISDASTMEVGNVLKTNVPKTANEGSTPPKGGVTFTFRHLNYWVNAGGEDRQLLRDISGYVQPGQLTALMGASGAGKTTLLDNLSQRKAEGRLEGELLLNGASLSTSFARSCGFCMQQDIHEPTATVREALQFSAHMRQSSHIPEHEKMAYVEEVIALLELESVADALVGMTGDGQLNVEERKRVTIAVELAAKPSALLFLDEPTSGLDSPAAFSIVSSLRKIAAQGIPVVCTIHQPSGVLFEMFDHVMLLGPGGRTVYFGETGRNSSIIADYFARHGAIMDAHDNPAEFIISTVVSKEEGDKDWPEIWNKSVESGMLQAKIEAFNQSSKCNTGLVANAEDEQRQYALGLFAQIVALTRRHWITVWRDGQYNFSRLAKAIFMQTFISFTFFHVQNTSAGLQNHMLGILLSSWVVIAMSADVQAVWYEKWSIFEMRERSGIYDWKALLAALWLVEIPWHIVIYTVTFFCSYWTYGFSSTASIAGFIYFMSLVFGIFGLGVTYLTAALFPNDTMSGYAISLLWVTLLMFSGAANPRSALNDFYRPWLWWADPLTYYFESTVSTVLHNVVVQCTLEEMAIFDPPSGQTCIEYASDYVRQNPGYLVNPKDMSNCSYCPYSVGDDFAQSLHFFNSERWRDWAVFVGFCITNAVLTFLVVWIMRVKFRLHR